MDFIEPCFGIGHNLSLICQMTSEDIKHQLIIISRITGAGLTWKLQNAHNIYIRIIRQSGSDLHKFSDDTQLFSSAIPADFGTLIKQRRVSNMSRLGWISTNSNLTMTKLRHWLSVLALGQVSATGPNCCDKWEAKLNKDINWCITFKKMQQIQEIKLKWFQIRLVHRIIATNVVLMHMGIENDITCSFCRQDRDSVNHIFWSCTHVRSFWEQFQIVLNAGCSNATSVTLNENIVLFGHDIHFKSDNTFDLIILQAKFFIYKCKINKTIPQLHSFKRYLKTNFEVYKYNTKLNMSYDKIIIEWCPYQPLIDV